MHLWKSYRHWIVPDYIKMYRCKCTQNTLRTNRDLMSQSTSGGGPGRLVNTLNIHLNATTFSIYIQQLRLWKTRLSLTWGWRHTMVYLLSDVDTTGVSPSSVMYSSYQSVSYNQVGLFRPCLPCWVALTYIRKKDMD